MDRRIRCVEQGIGNHVRAESVPSHDKRLACDLELAERKRHRPNPVDPLPAFLPIQDVTGLGVDRVSQEITGDIHQLGLPFCGDQRDIAEILPYRLVNDGQESSSVGQNGQFMKVGLVFSEVDDLLGVAADRGDFVNAGVAGRDNENFFNR